MPRKSYETLLNTLSQCTQDMKEIIRDPEWSGQNDVIIRAATAVCLRRVAESARNIVYIHFIGYSVNATPAIRRAINLRAPGCLLRIRWSGSECIFVTADEPAPFCETLASIIRNEGLTASLSWTTYSGNIEQDYGRAVQSMQIIQKEQTS